MDSAVLKSLLMAGVEWELADATSQFRVQSSEFRVRDSAGFETRIDKSAQVQRVLSNDEILAEGTRLAAEEDILAAIQKFDSHPLYHSAKNTVLPHLGGARLCVVTDMPSLADDASGEILSGAEGELFDKMLAAIGLSRADISIVPLIFWRPAGGRTPTDEELAATRPFIDRMISGAPKILTLGKLAAEKICGAKLPGDHGKVFGNVIVTYKPDFIAANPSVKAAVFEALKLI